MKYIDAWFVAGARCFDHTERMWEERSCSQVRVTPQINSKQKSDSNLASKSFRGQAQSKVCKEIFLRPKPDHSHHYYYDDPYFPNHHDSHFYSHDHPDNDDDNDNDDDDDQVRQWQHWGSGCYNFTCQEQRLHMQVSIIMSRRMIMKRIIMRMRRCSFGFIDLLWNAEVKLSPLTICRCSTTLSPVSTLGKKLR